MLYSPNDQVGINYNSPTANYAMGGMSNIPPNPIGGIPYGYQQPMMYPSMYGGYGQPNPYGGGYMGGYYGGGYINNPYLYQQQMKAQEAARREQERQNSDFMKGLSTLAHKSLGDIDKYENFEEHLTQYDPITIDNETYQQEVEYNKFNNLVPVQPNWAYIAYCNKVHEEYAKRFPPNMGLFEYLEKSGELILDDLVDKGKQLSRNGKLQYDTDQYRKIIESHRQASSYFNSVLTGVNSVEVDDMEIQLPQNGDRSRIVVTAPSHMQEYNARKAVFLQEIMKNASQLQL